MWYEIHILVRMRSVFHVPTSDSMSLTCSHIYITDLQLLEILVSYGKNFKLPIPLELLPIRISHFHLRIWAFNLCSYY